jgi:hypothetical protein
MLFKKKPNVKSYAKRFRLLERKYGYLKFQGILSQTPLSIHTIECIRLQGARTTDFKGSFTHEIRIYYSLRVGIPRNIILHVGQYDFRKEGYRSEEVAKRLTFKLAKYMKSEQDKRMLLWSSYSDFWEDEIKRNYRFIG